MTLLTTRACRLPSGEEYYEHHIGDFVEANGRFITSIRFSREDAQLVARLLVSFTDPSLVAVALYPWVEAAWESLIAQEWTTMSTETFVRHRWLRSAGSHRWEVGRAQSVDKLVDVIYWAWTLPGRDTLLFVPMPDTSTAAVEPLVKEFVDDQEDNDENELRLLKHYPIVASRGFEGRYLRVFSTTMREVALT